MKKRNIIILISVAVLCVCFICAFKCLIVKKDTDKVEKITNNMQTNEKINENLFYSKAEIEQIPDEDTDRILTHLKYISKYMNKNYPGINVYISSAGYSEDKMYFNGYQMINRALIEDTGFVITYDKEKEKILDINFLTNKFGDKDIDTTKVIKYDEVKEIVDRTCEENNDKLKSFDGASEITSTTNLMYTIDNKLIYKSNFSNGSYINIDANTGEVLEVNFQNTELK